MNKPPITQQLGFEDENPEYALFVNKFKPKKTTDDCYTPPNIYDAVKAWACKEYDIDPETVVRPFYPGGDYERFPYQDGCTVLDNPPFSILTQIERFYIARGIRFFLFAPSLTCIAPGRICTSIVCDAKITYENKAVVLTAFVTNLDPTYIIRSAPDLHKIIERENAKNEQAAAANLPKYEYPDNVITAARMQYYAAHGVDFRVKKSEAQFIRRLDAQRANDKAIFGGGYLVSERAAAERAAAERAAAERAAAVKWQLSEREKEIIKLLGGQND